MLTIQSLGYCLLFSHMLQIKCLFLRVKQLIIKNLHKEISSFFAARVFSYVVDMAGMYLFVSVMMANKMFAKVIMNVVVIVINYIFSKLFIFNQDKNAKKV